MPAKSSRALLSITIAIALVLPLYVVLWPGVPVVEGDSPQYMAVAQDLSDGSLDELHLRAPGYPLLLAITGSAEAPQRLLFAVSLLLHGLSVWLLAITLAEIRVSQRLIVAFAAVAMLPPYVEPAAHVMTENLTQFTLAAGVSMLVLWWSRGKPWQLGSASLAFAYAGLTRPTYQALALGMAVCLLLAALPGHLTREYRRTAIVTSVGLLAGSVLLLGGFAAFQQVRFGYFGISPTAGFHLTTKTMRLFERLPDEHAVVREILVRERDRQLTQRGGTHTATQTVWGARAELQAATGMSTPELSRYLIELDLILIRKAPIEYLEEVARSLATYWFPPAGALATRHSSVLRWLWALLHAALVATFWAQIIVLLGWIAMRVTAGGRHPAGARIAATGLQTLAFAAAAMIVFYTMLLTCAVDIGEVRQRRSTDLLVIFLCFTGLSIWIATRQHWRKEPIVS